jgi:hypothetical protein
MRGWPVVLFLLAGAFAPSVVCAQVYHWVDDQGVVHYSTGLESVPERYRPHARPLPVSPVTPAPAETARETPARAATTIPFIPGAPILVDARINGAGPLRLILDTGADRTMVAPEALRRLGVATAEAARGEIRGVTGAAPVEVVRVNSIEVGQAAFGPLVIIAHDADLTAADGLLGRDFLAAFTVTIDAAAGVVTLAPN